MNQKQISHNLRIYRRRWRGSKPECLHLTQEELSIRLGYNETTYGQWERGRNLPSRRQDLIKLIFILYGGRGIETLEEANSLLRLCEFSTLTPEEAEEIGFVQNSFVQNSFVQSRIDMAEELQLPSHRTKEDGQQIVQESITGEGVIHETFPTDIFRRRIEQGKTIRILNTWIPNLDSFIEPLLTVLRNGSQIQLLLLTPESSLADARNQALEALAKPILKDPVQQGVFRNLELVDFLCQSIDPPLRAQVQVRFYNSLPSISIYQADDTAYVGFFFHGRLAINSPQIEIAIDSFFGQRVQEEFDLLWESGIPI